MSQQTAPAMRALRATYDEARLGRTAAEALSPLLGLLDPAKPGEDGSLEELTDLLRTILRVQEQTLQALETLAHQISAEGAAP